jgi:hypothetical protein
MAMGDNDAEQRGVVVLQPRDPGEGHVVFWECVEREAQIENQPSTVMLELDARPPNLTSAAMDAGLQVLLVSGSVGPAARNEQIVRREEGGKTVVTGDPPATQPALLVLDDYVVVLRDREIDQLTTSGGSAPHPDASAVATRSAVEACSKRITQRSRNDPSGRSDPPIGTPRAVPRMSRPSASASVPRRGRPGRTGFPRRMRTRLT